MVTHDRDYVVALIDAQQNDTVNSIWKKCPSCNTLNTTRKRRCQQCSMKLLKIGDYRAVSQKKQIIHSLTTLQRTDPPVHLYMVEKGVMPRMISSHCSLSQLGRQTTFPQVEPQKKDRQSFIFLDPLNANPGSYEGNTKILKELLQSI